MQNRYAGDIGDYGKFSLLRCLFNTTTYKLGVIWYLFPDENHNQDGCHIEYLQKKEFTTRDTELCSTLQRVVENTRSVHALERANLLQSGTVYYSDPLNFHLENPSQTAFDKEARANKRDIWLKNAIEVSLTCDSLFLDPDNGLEIKSSAKMNQLKSGKFAYYSEIQRLNIGKNTCVVYHHLNRHRDHGTHENQIITKISELREKVSPSGKIFALRFRPKSPRAFFILTSKKIEVDIQNRLEIFHENEPRAHWDLLTIG